MNLYSNLLLSALEDEPAAPVPIAELVTRVIARRAALERSETPGEKFANALAYDVALCRLCERLGILHDLGTGDPAQARGRAEADLVARLPGLRTALSAGS